MTTELRKAESESADNLKVSELRTRKSRSSMLLMSSMVSSGRIAARVDGV